MRCPACDHENIPGEDLCAECGMDLAGLDVQAWGVDPKDPLLATPLAELPLKKPLVLGADSTVAEAVSLMCERREGCVFIENEAELIGVFTERDVAVRVASRGRDPQQTRLKEVMTTGARSASTWPRDSTRRSRCRSSRASTPNSASPTCR